MRIISINLVLSFTVALNSRYSPSVRYAARFVKIRCEPRADYDRSTFEKVIHTNIGSTDKAFSVSLAMQTTYQRE